MRPILHVSDDDGRVVRSKVGRSDRCGKQTYSSRKLAKTAAKWSSKMTGETIAAYHCGPCHCFHIGHPIGSRSKAS